MLNTDLKLMNAKYTCKVKFPIQNSITKNKCFGKKAWMYIYY